LFEYFEKIIGKNIESVKNDHIVPILTAFSNT